LKRYDNDRSRFILQKKKFLTLIIIDFVNKQAGVRPVDDIDEDEQTPSEPHRYDDDNAEGEKQVHYGGAVQSPAQIGPALTPASIGPAAVQKPVEKPAAKTTSKNDIWSNDEIAKAGYIDDVQDTREVPQYVYFTVRFIESII